MHSFEKWQCTSIKPGNFNPRTVMLSKHLLLLKRSPTCLHYNNFSSSKRSGRHLARRLEDFLKTFWKTKNCYAEDVFKTFWRHVLKHGVSVSNKSKSVFNKSISHKSISDKSKANPKRIRTQWFRYSSYFETQAAFLF